MVSPSVAVTVRCARLSAVVIAGMPRGAPVSVSRQMPGWPGHAYAYWDMENRLRPLLRRPAVLDAGLAALLAALSVIGAWDMLAPGSEAVAKLGYVYSSPQLLHWREVGWLAAVAAELGALPLRRRFPLAVLAVTLTAAVAHWLLLPITPAPSDVAIAVAVYTLASARSRPFSAAAVAAGLPIAIGLDALGFVTLPGPGQGKAIGATFLVKPASLIVPLLVLAAAWLAGDSARTRRAYIAEVERRAADAERDLGRQAELAAAAERERITRELHDVIAHALSVMVIQAQGAGSALRRRRPAETGEALDAIVTTGRGGLAETRRLLGVVRRPSGPGDPELAPQPSLGGLAALAARVRGAGTPVELNVTGLVRPLDGGIELSAYRIIQEALTNTMKHGGPGASASVGVHYAVGELTVEVTDDGTGPGPDGPGGPDPAGQGLAGQGLPGMRARVAMLGGELAVGRAGGRGFRVRARLPVAESLPGPAQSLPGPAGSLP
jgi:signal transduction histidine kinase